MNNTEDIIKRLVPIRDWMMTGDRELMGTCINDAIEKLKNYKELEERMKAMYVKWIKCSERMPDEFVKECLVVNKGETCFALHGINRWGNRYFIEPYEDGEELDDITYWMPLPEPPNVKK